MAKRSTLAYVKNGYAQVEPNRLTAMVNGEMESQAPAIEADGSTIPVIENGMFLCLTVASGDNSPFGRVAVRPSTAAASDEAYLVFNERKVYDERESLIDYAMIAENSVDGMSYPRLFKITAGDVFTTNCIADAVVNPAVGNVLYVGNDGYLTNAKGKNTSICFVISKVYTMPNGDPGVKLVAENFK